jgi:hypothetical protein
LAIQKTEIKQASNFKQSKSVEKGKFENNLPVVQASAAVEFGGTVKMVKIHYRS